MKVLVVVLIPVFDLPLSPQQGEALLKINQQLGDFQITFLLGEHLHESKSELTVFCPGADFMTFDARYFENRHVYTKLLLSPQFYDQLGWTRFILLLEMNTQIVRNELMYWCKQGYDFIQPYPHQLKASGLGTKIIQRTDPTRFLDENQTLAGQFEFSCGLSLRKVETFQKLVRRKKRSIHQFVSSTTSRQNDSLYWEYYTNRWFPELLLPNSIARDRFARKAGDDIANDSETPFGYTGVYASEKVNSKL